MKTCKFEIYFFSDTKFVQLRGRRATIKFDLKRRARKTGVHTHDSFRGAPFKTSPPLAITRFAFYTTDVLLAGHVPPLPARNFIFSNYSPLPSLLPSSNLSRYFRVLIAIASKETGEKKTKTENSFGQARDRFPTANGIFRIVYIYSFLFPSHVSHDNLLNGKRRCEMKLIDSFI